MHVIRMIPRASFITVWTIAILLMSCERYCTDTYEDSRKIAFWNTTKKGANIFNSQVSRGDIRSAKACGIQFIRLALDKFPSKRRDFLIGDADAYTKLDKNDLSFLKFVINMFEEEGMPVVITMLSLPGSRWKQLNNDRDDLRIWSDIKFQMQAAKFWKDLAKELREYKMVIGYNILNEPHPERLFNTKDCHVDGVNQDKVQRLLFDFNRAIVREIRKIDRRTPIIIDSSGYADPNTFKGLEPLHEDWGIIYAFHMYEPYEYTSHSHNRGQYSYPGKVAGKYWSRGELRKYMQRVYFFQKAHKVPSNRIFVGEFGGYRRQKGLPLYLADLIKIFEENEWHRAFYAWSDDWDGMNYRLGDEKLPWEYWKAKEKGIDYQLVQKDTYPQFAVLKSDLKRGEMHLEECMSGKNKLN
jgi:aryl-phospho-beta-D-glucosidase BglC (GH1 family)